MERGQLLFKSLQYVVVNFFASLSSTDLKKDTTHYTTHLPCYYPYRPGSTTVHVKTCCQNPFSPPILEQQKTPNQPPTNLLSLWLQLLHSLKRKICKRHQMMAKIMKEIQVKLLQTFLVGFFGKQIFKLCNKCEKESLINTL